MITVITGAVSADMPCILYDNILSRGVLSGPGGGTGAFENVIGPQTFDFWRPASVPARLVVTMGAAVTVDCICVAAHNVGTVGGSLRFQYSLDAGVTWVNITTVTPTNDDPIMVVFPAVTAAVFGVLVQNAIPDLGILYMGQRMVFPSPVAVPYVPSNWWQLVELSAAVSVRGQLLANRAARLGRSGKIPFTPLPASFVDGQLAAFRSAFNSGAPFFFAPSPSQMPDDLGYMWRGSGAEELRPTFDGGRIWAALTMGVDAYGG